MYYTQMNLLDILQPHSYITDWQEKVFEFAPIANVNISATGGTKNSSYASSISYLYQDGIVGLSKSNYSRLTARTTIS